MIIAQRPTSLCYGADAVAQSLRSVIAVPAARPVVRVGAGPGAKAPMDLAALYPALFAPTGRPAVLHRAARAVAFRLSVFGTVAAMLVVLHH